MEISRRPPASSASGCPGRAPARPEREAESSGMRAPATCAAASQPRSSKAAAAAGGREEGRERGRGAPLRAQGQRCGRAAAARAPRGSIEKLSVSFTNRRLEGLPSADAVREGETERSPGGGSRGRGGGGERRDPRWEGLRATPGCGDGVQGRKWACVLRFSSVEEENTFV